MPDYLPTNDAALLAWATNYSSKLTANFATYGVTTAQATTLAGLLTTYSTKLTVAAEPSTRTRGSISAKDDAKKALVANIRDLARIINAFPTITNQMRLDLGLTPRSGTITPINPPTESPVIKIVSAMGRILKLSVSSADSTRRGKPAGCSGCTLFSYIGDAPPADINKWAFEGSITKTTFDLEFPATVAAGSQVWICGFWFNPRSQSGPACTPISAYIAGGVTMAEAA